MEEGFLADVCWANVFEWGCSLEPLGLSWRRAWWVGETVIVILGNDWDAWFSSWRSFWRWYMIADEGVLES